MKTENLSTLKIHKLTQEQYNRELINGTLDLNALYLTPDEEINLNNYVTKDQLEEELSAIPTPDVSGQINEHNTDINAHQDLREAISNSTPSWNNLKDKPFYEEVSRTVIVEEQTLTGFELMENTIYTIINPFSFDWLPGETYIIVWDGIEYVCTVEDLGELGYIGNPNYVMMQSGGDIPFTLVFAGDLYVVTEDAADHTITINKCENIIHHIDPKYINDMYYETVDQVLDHYIAEGSWSTGYFSALISVNNAIILDPTKEYILTDHTTGISAHVRAVYVASGGNAGTPDNYETIEYRCSDGSEGRHLGLTFVKSDNSLRYHHGSTGSGDVHEISLRDSESTLVPIKEKYIPDTIARKSDVGSMLSWKKLLDKPFGDEYACEVIVDTREVTFDPYYASIEEIDTGYFANDCDIIRVTFDEVVYILPRYTASYDGWNYYGNAWISFGKNANEYCENVDDTTTPFCISFSDVKFSGELMIQVEDQLPYHTVKIEQVIEYSAITLDEKYIPDTIARMSDVEDMISEINIGGGGSSASDVSDHNSDVNAHNDIREVLNSKANISDIPTALAELSDDISHRTVTDAEKADWNAKSNFSGNYNDLTNKPTIPSIEGLATESYVNSAAEAVKNELLNGAGSAYDTLKELGDLITENVNAVEALNIVAVNKADAEHDHNDKYYTKSEINNLELITLSDIDAICSATTNAQVATISEGVF